MNTDSIFTSIPEIHQIFDGVCVGLIVFDPDRRVVLLNRLAGKLLGVEIASAVGMHCFELFCQVELRCQSCLLESRQAGVEIARSYTVTQKDGQKLLLKASFVIHEHYSLCTLQDVTKEVTLVKKIDLSKKEAEAKAILLERKLVKLKEEQANASNIIHNLPEGLVGINQLFDIQQSNQAVGEIFGLNGAQKCYELLLRNEPCKLCPVEKGFDVAHGFKKRHSVGAKSFTELILRGSDEGSGLLLFTDATRQINLIEQIKRQQTTLTGVAEVARMMQTVSDSASVLKYFIDKILTVLPASAAVLLVNDVRPGHLWQIFPANICENDVGRLTRAYLSRDVQSGEFKADVICRHLPWQKFTVVALSGGHGMRVGMLALDAEMSSDEQEKLEIFADTVGAYIHNQLLMKQLREKANTDALTGLYNRGYFDLAFEEEREKLSRYAIDFAVVTLDVNMLKKANDKFGHEVGDILLKKVGKLLIRSARNVDVVARTGGDEFSVLLTDTDDSGAKEYKERLQGSVLKNVFLELEGGESFPVTASVGYAGSDLCGVDELMRFADERMYEDKTQFYSTKEKYR